MNSSLGKVENMSLIRHIFIFFIMLCSCRQLHEVPLWGIYENEIVSKNSYSDPFRDVDLLIFEPWEDYSTLQGGKSTDLEDIYGFIESSRKKVKPVYAHEVMWYGNMYHENLDTMNLRRKATTLLMAGAFINFGDMNGNSSSGFSGCLDPDSAHIEAHNVLKTVWNIFDKLPFHILKPNNELIEGGYCISDNGSNHLFWLPARDSVRIRLHVPLKGTWINTGSGAESEALIETDTFIPPDGNGWLLWVSD